MGIPDYIIYDELKKEREERRERPRIRVPNDPPKGYGREEEEPKEEKDDANRGVTTFQM